ncbi:hypothetical protein [Vibrio parahaemolyticus]|uniref:hypothetical protein n=1 Tax=Vibrio parahaemolyticus TaxID=670 RepID=UPI00235FD8DD|nr:hypothetical protein [Vibrio parahaemolyticus]
MTIFIETLHEHELYKKVHEHSLKLVDEINHNLSCKTIYGGDDVAIYAVGSLGRCEISKNSDIDIYAISEADMVVKSDIDILNKAAKKIYSLTGEVYDIDKKCLKVYGYKELIDSIGNSFDDYNNTFTARMTLILEGRCLFNIKQYEKLIKLVLDGYFESRSFRNDKYPTIFLLDDIMRYWKTVCVNYEVSYNNLSPKIEMKKISLRFSRSLMVFSTILNILAQEHVTSNSIYNFCLLSPLERLAKALDEIGDISLLDDYSTYLNLYLEFINMKSEVNVLKRLDNDIGFRNSCEEKGEKCIDILYKFLSSDKLNSALKKHLIM